MQVRRNLRFKVIVIHSILPTRLYCDLPVILRAAVPPKLVRHVTTGQHDNDAMSEGIERVYSQAQGFRLALAPRSITCTISTRDIENLEALGFGVT